MRGRQLADDSESQHRVSDSEHVRLRNGFTSFIFNSSAPFPSRSPKLQALDEPPLVNMLSVQHIADRKLARQKNTCRKIRVNDFKSKVNIKVVLRLHLARCGALTFKKMLGKIENCKRNAR